MERDEILKSIIAPIIVGILLFVSGFVFNSYFQDRQELDQIDYDFNQANASFNSGDFEKAISEYNDILRISYNKFPDKCALASFKMGRAYASLAVIKDKEINLRYAISAYKNALKVYTFEKYPTEYASTQYNLGEEYTDLSAIRDPETNAQNAISAYENALKVYTFEKYPTEYASTQYSLGYAYGCLGKVRDQETNAQNSIQACKNALKVFTFETDPGNYATTQGNLGMGICNL